MKPIGSLLEWRSKWLDLIEEPRIVVDKYKTRGKVFTKKEVIEAQLRGEFSEGEIYGKALLSPDEKRAERRKKLIKLLKERKARRHEKNL